MSIKPLIVPFTFRNYAGQSSFIQTVGSSTAWVDDDYGNSWRINIFHVGTPGDDSEPPADPMVDVRLENSGDISDNEGVEADAYFTFILRDARGSVYAEPDWDEPAAVAPGTTADASWQAVRRSEILNERNNILRDGNLHIDVHIQLKESLGGVLFKAPPSIVSKMEQLFEDEEDKDVSFQVGGETLSAHKIILKKDPSVLFSFAEETEDGSPIIINDTTPAIFRMILRYIYTGCFPSLLVDLQDGWTSRNTVEQCKDVIDAANRFGVVGLKLAADEALVEAMTITAKNVADWLIFADAKTCPLLKEQATAYFVSRSEDLLNSDTSNQLRESPRLLTELMVEIARSANHRRDFEDDESRLSVKELRYRLREVGLDVDGDKEILVARLLKANRGQQMDETE